MGKWVVTNLRIGNILYCDRNIWCFDDYLVLDNNVAS